MEFIHSHSHQTPFDSQPAEHLFEKVATDLLTHGFSVNPAALPSPLTSIILNELAQLSHSDFTTAAIGRDNQLVVNPFVRSVAVCWIEDQTPACQQWNFWAQELQLYLNRQLFLGLSTFESHFAYYKPGDFYKRHYDSFITNNLQQNKSNRRVSLVAYFNNDWLPEHGGELVVYMDDSDQQGVKIPPAMGMLVAFLSDEFPHEVLPCFHDRYSIAGWFRA